MASPTVDKTSGKPRRKRRWLQFGLPTLLGLVTVLCLVLGLWVQQSERQRRAVAALRSLGGSFYYGNNPFIETPIGAWLRKRLGSDYFMHVVAVDLDGTQVSDAGLEHLNGLTGLHDLSLRDTHVSNAGLVHLKDLTALKRLSLDNTQVSDTGLAHLKGLTALQGLYLINTDVSGAGLEYLTKLTELEYLNLLSTHVSDAGLEHLKGLTGLKYLDLTNTHVSDVGVAELRAALPDCYIDGP
jgi:hypothetical protein